MSHDTYGLHLWIRDKEKNDWEEDILKRKYLYRLVAMVILALMVPATIFLNIFWKSSFEGMEQANEVYYESMLDSYISIFDNKLRQLENFAATLSADSRESANVLYQGAEEISNNPYQLYMVTTELRKNYAISDVTDWGIYFYDTEKIIRQGTASSYEQYLHNYLDENVEGMQFAEFFSEENYGMSKMIFGSIVNYVSHDDSLLVGICTRMGKDRDKALVFFELSPDNISDSLVIMKEQGIAYYLIDEEDEKSLIGWGDEPENHVEAVLSGEENREMAGMKQKVLYQKTSDFSKLSVAIYITGDSLQSHIITYAFDMRKILLAMIFLLLLISVCAVYISYRPIYELVNELGYTGGSELETIRSTLDNKSAKITEQEMLIMDLLLNHLIYGVHVSQKRIDSLGIDQSMKYYCVFLLKGYVLLSGEMEKLSEEIDRKLQARLFMTDWQEGKDSIFIVFLKSDQKNEVHEILTNWMKECFIEKYDLYAGKTVERLDDIQISLRSCCEQIKKDEDADKKVKEDKKEALKTKHEELKDEILTYLELNYRDANLSQTEVADLFGISNYTLSRLFKNKVGVGFTEYLVAKRIEHASELLLTSSHSVSEVSAMAGFSSINHFSKTFKIYTGVSPTVYRNQK